MRSAWSEPIVNAGTWVVVAMCVAVGGCKDKEVDASDDQAVAGDACAVNPEGDGPQCAEGWACEPVGDADVDGDHVCAAPLRLQGQVSDALTGLALEGALVAALDDTGAPVGDVAVTDAEGHYVLQVSARRDADGNIADTLQWTLFATAQDYQPFPTGLRPAIPINAADAVEEPGSDDTTSSVIANASTDVGLLRLPDSQTGGRTISGTVEGDHPGGTLVVAEGSAPAPYTVADASGHYTIFNVPAGAASIVGYRRGLSVAAVSPGEGDQADVDLAVLAQGDDALARVDGSVNIVNAPGGAQTSVVLVPVSVYNEALERGPVPFGLRAPEPPLGVSIGGAFSIPGVPPGKYRVLAAFENDGLVRDPDEGIAGTTIPEITVGDAAVTVDQSFKITEALAVESPGAELPERVDANPTFVFADDSSEDGYQVVVYDAFGALIWENLAVARVTGNKSVEVPYEGPSLISGMYYQFRATSFKSDSAISRTEDLRGVFIGP